MAGVSRRDFLQQAGGASAALAFMVANGITLDASPLGLPIGAQAWPHRARIGANSYAGLAALLKDMKAIGLDAIELVSPSGDFASLKTASSEKGLRRQRHESRARTSAASRPAAPPDYMGHDIGMTHMSRPV